MDGRYRRTVTEIMEVDELIVPLCKDADGVLDEGNDDKEATNSGEIAIDNQQVSKLVPPGGKKRSCPNVVQSNRKTWPHLPAVEKVGAKPPSKTARRNAKRTVLWAR